MSLRTCFLITGLDFNTWGHNKHHIKADYLLFDIFHMSVNMEDSDQSSKTVCVTGVYLARYDIRSTCQQCQLVVKDTKPGWGSNDIGFQMANCNQIVKIFFPVSPIFPWNISVLQ